MKSSLVNQSALYRITVPKDEFLQSGLEKGYHFKIIGNQINGEQVTFVTNRENLDRLLIQFPDLNYSRRFIYFWKFKVIPKIISVICIILIIILFWSSSSLIREITFKHEENFSQKVYDFVYQRLRKVGPFYFMKEGLNDLSGELRENFIDYAWIGLERRGGKIIIDIEQQEIGEGQNDDLTITGDLIASKDGYIKGYLIERGVNLITINQSVKKGQLLVSGNLKYHNPGEAKWTRAKGLILADTVEYLTKSIPKVQMVVEYNGNTQNRFCFNFFGKKIYTKKSPFKEADISASEVFNLGFLQLFEEQLKEKQTITTVHTEETALALAESMIYKEFRKEHKHPKEKIIQLVLIENISSNDYFVFTFLVQKCENIAIFKRN